MHSSTLYAHWKELYQRDTDNSTNYYDTPKYAVHAFEGAVSKAYRRLPESRNRRQDSGVPLGGESDRPVLVAKTLQNEIQDAHVCEALTDVLELVTLLKHLG